VSIVTKVVPGAAFKPEKTDNPNLQGQIGTVCELLTQRDNDPTQTTVHGAKNRLGQHSVLGS
jgi:hypothetical protein